MNIHPTLIILILLLVIGYVLQNLVIYDLRKRMDKQFEINEMQIEVSQKMIDLMKLKDGK